MELQGLISQCERWNVCNAGTEGVLFFKIHWCLWEPLELSLTGLKSKCLRVPPLGFCIILRIVFVYHALSLLQLPFGCILACDEHLVKVNSHVLLHFSVLLFNQPFFCLFAQVYSSFCFSKYLLYKMFFLCSFQCEVWYCFKYSLESQRNIFRWDSFWCFLEIFLGVWYKAIRSFKLSPEKISII